MIHDECGVFAVFDPSSQREDAARLVFLGLFALQHRGEDSSGIAVNQRGALICQRRRGLVTEGFDEVALQVMLGHAGIGHVRYPSDQESGLESAQPMLIKSRRGQVALAFNGALTNAAELRSRLQAQGAIFQSHADSEIILALLARQQVLTDDLEQAVLAMMMEMRGAYAMVIQTADQIVGVRDPHGIRPLCLGQLGESWLFASESCAIDAVGGTFVRDLSAGELVSLTADGLKSSLQTENNLCQTCLFEFVYFARPDSTLDQSNVYAARVSAGKELAVEHPCQADLVIGAPDSGTAASIGFAQAMDLPHGSGILKNRYVGRTFLQPNRLHREWLVHLKYTALADAVRGQTIVLVDDSIIRGTTTKHVIALLRQAGAKAVHMRIASPPMQYPCLYGVATPSQKDLSACEMTKDELMRHIDADSLEFLSLSGLIFACSTSKSFCSACFDGSYPVEPPPSLCGTIRTIDSNWFYGSDDQP